MGRNFIMERALTDPAQRALIKRQKAVRDRAKRAGLIAYQERAKRCMRKDCVPGKAIPNGVGTHFVPRLVGKPMTPNWSGSPKFVLRRQRVCRSSNGVKPEAVDRG